MISSYVNDNEIAKWNFNNLFYCYFTILNRQHYLFRVAKEKQNLHFYTLRCIFLVLYTVHMNIIIFKSHGSDV